MSLGQNLKKLCEAHGYHTARQHFVDGLAAGKINLNQVRLRDLAESFMGPTWAAKLRKRAEGLRTVGESTDAVDASAFADITGQLLVNEVKQKYSAPEFIGSQIVETIPITNGNLGPQRTPWLSNVIDDAYTIQPGMNYPRTAFVENFIDYPAPEKFGEICAVTMEMIYSDLTAQARDSAGDVGRRTALNKEERIAKVVLGVVNNHSWNGTSYNTYQTSTPWINKLTGKTVLDWTNINDIEQLFVNMLDPNTGKPIFVKPEWVLCMPAKYYTIKRIFAASDVRTNDGASNTQATYAPSPIETQYSVYKSPVFFQQLKNSGVSASNANEYVLMGNRRAFVWRQAMPLEVVEAPAQNPAQFHQDIAIQIRAREFGVAGVQDPRFVALSINA